MVKKIHLIILAIIVLISIGCSSQTLTSASTSTKQQVTKTSATSTPVILAEQGTTDAKTVWENAVIQRFSTLYNNYSAVYYGATPDGRYLFGKLLPIYYQPTSGRDLPEEIVLYSVGIGSERIIAVSPDLNHSYGGLSADNQWLTFYLRNLPGLSNSLNWTLYAYNITSGLTIIVEHNTAGSGMYPNAQISNGKIAWTTYNGPATLDQSEASVQVMDLATQRRQIIATHAGDVTFSWPWIGWGQVTGVDNNGNPTANESFENLLTNEKLSLPFQASEMILSGTSLVYVPISGPPAFYIPDIRNPTTAVQVIPSEMNQNTFSFNGRYIGWSGNDLPKVYDIQQRLLIMLPLKYNAVPSEFSIVANNLILWNEDPNSAQQEASAGVKQLNLPLIESILYLPNS